MTFLIDFCGMLCDGLEIVKKTSAMDCDGIDKITWVTEATVLHRKSQLSASRNREIQQIHGGNTHYYHFYVDASVSVLDDGNYALKLGNDIWTIHDTYPAEDECCQPHHIKILASKNYSGPTNQIVV